MRNSKMFRGILHASVLSTAFLLASCGNNGSPVKQVVKDIELTTYKNDSSEVIIDFLAKLDLGQAQLPSIQFDINHPKTKQNLGAFKMLYGFDGTSGIGFDLNLTNASKGYVKTQPTLLPNGSAIPVSGVEPLKVLNFPIVGATSANVYLAMYDGVFMLGTAVVIPQFDVIGNTIGSLNAFPSFKIKEVQGVAGIFTGSGTNDDGIAMFFDFSKYINPKDLINIGTTTRLASAQSSSRVVLTSAKSSINYKAFYELNASQLGKLEKELNKVREEKQVLDI